MAEFIVLLLVVLIICLWLFLYWSCEGLIKDINQYKAGNQKESKFLSWTLGGFLLLFHFMELTRLKNKYLGPNDYDFIARYKHLYFLFWLFLLGFISIVVIEVTTSF